MKTIKYFLGILLIAAPFILTAQDIISAKDAAAQSKKGDAVLVSARRGADYNKVHAIGSVNIDPATLADANVMLKPVNEIAKILGDNGISKDKKILIYDDGSMKNAGRLYWTLKYMGATDVKVVEGGMKAWRISRLPVTKNPTNVKKTTFTPNVQKKYLADHALVARAMTQSNYILLDVRTPAEYNGTAPGYEVRGHIVNAVNIDHTELLQANGSFKPVDELKKIFTAKGITPDKKVIAYCRSSVRAGVAFVALHSLLNYPEIMVYDGAILEWQIMAPDKVETTQ